MQLQRSIYQIFYLVTFKIKLDFLLRSFMTSNAPLLWSNGQTCFYVLISYFLGGWAIKWLWHHNKTITLSQIHTPITFFTTQITFIMISVGHGILFRSCFLWPRVSLQKCVLLGYKTIHQEWFAKICQGTVCSVHKKHNKLVICYNQEMKGGWRWMIFKEVE